MQTQVAALEVPSRRADVTNALVRQHNAILSNLHLATDADECEAVLDAIQFARELWSALDYGYKVVELANLLVNRMYQQHAAAIDMRDEHCRKNTSQWRLWDSEVGRYDRAIADACMTRQYTRTL